MTPYISDKDGDSRMADQSQYQLFETAAGIAAIGWTGGDITRFRLPAPATIAAVIAAAIRYFEGERVEFFEAPVALGEPPPFFAQVYDHVRTLGWGETTTYGAVARALDAGPEHARAVGQAMATNPVPLIIPCHRVMAAGGGIGWFSAPGGSQSKARMLELEGLPVAPVQRGFDF